MLLAQAARDVAPLRAALTFVPEYLRSYACRSRGLHRIFIVQALAMLAERAIHESDVPEGDAR